MAEKQSVISEESFEYIETPPARAEQVPVEDCGVRTTKVSYLPLDQAVTFS